MASRPSRKYGILSLFVFILIATVCITPLLVNGFMQSSTATTTAVTASPATITLGDTVTFTATVTAATGTPTGLVTFFDGNTPLGSGTLNQGSPDQATFSTSLLSAAGSPHSITAVYQGDAANHTSSTSPAISEMVNPRTSSTGVVLNPTSVAVGQPSTATVTLTDSGSVPPGTADTFTPTGAPATGRTGFTSTLFADGLVLVAGGTDANNNVLNSAEIYSVSGATFSGTGVLNTARTGAVAVLLPTGKVLIAGGSSDGTANGALNTAELFDPSAGTFTNTSQNMTAARFGTTATLLNIGKVLIAGGQNSGGVLNSAELYDPVTDTFTATGNLNTARTGYSATLLGTGEVLIAGGSSDGTANGALNSAELFDPAGNSDAGAFTAITGANSTLAAGRWQPEAVLLLSGKVLIAGGQNSGGALKSADLYDPGNTFAPSNSSMAQARANGSAVSLPNGMVLLAGGTTSKAVDLYDADSDKFDTTGSLQQSDTGLISTLLNNGDVLVVGLTTAVSPASDAELYTPSFNPLGTVTVSSSEVTDSITGACTLTPGTSTVSTCTSTVTPVNVHTSPHVITGTYPADAVHSTSKNPANLAVTPASTTTTVTSSSNPSIFGQPVTFIATVTDSSSGSTAQPTGSVQFVVDGVNFGSPVALTGATSSSSTAASQATATLSVNGSPHSVTANFVNADGNFTNSSGALTGGQTVTAANTTTTVHSSQNPSAFGQSITFTATVTDSSTGSTAQPTGSVQFVVDGVNFGSPVTLTGASSNSSSATSQATATLSVAGSPHSVTANYVNADGNFSNSSGALTGGQTVTAASTTTTVQSSQNPSAFGQPVTFTATVTDSSSGSTAQPTGSVQFVVDGVPFGSPVTLTGASSNSSSATSQATATLSVAGSPHSVTANYVNADGNFSNSSGALTGGQTVTPASTATTVQSSQNPSTFGQPVTFTATVTDVSVGSVAVPTGSVQFVVDGVPFGSPVVLTGATTNSSTATSQATATLSVAGSPHSVTANYVNADGNFSNSSGSLTGGQTVTAAATSTAVASSVNPSTFGQSVTFTATVNNNSTSPAPTGAVQFVIDGVNAGSPVNVTLGGGNTSTAAVSTSTLTVAGSPHSVTANFVNADGNFSNSTGTLNGGQTVTASGTTTSVVASPSTSTLGDTVTLTGTVTVNSPGTGTPTGLVTFFDGATPLGSGTLNQSSPDQATFTTSLLAVGSHSITAIYDGDANFSASPLSAATTETVNLRNTITSLVLNPTTVVVGQSSTTNVTVTDNGASTPPGTADTFSNTGAPATGRTGFTATLFGNGLTLGNGLVLVAGGTDANNNVLRSAEIYSVSAGTFSTTGNLNTARTGAVAVLLPNGKVLVAGGSSDGTANGALNSAELFNPALGTFSTTSHNMTAARFGTMATLLNTGKVLIAGGQNSGGVLNSAELYDPATDTFTATGNLTTARTGHSATLLGDGNVLIAGGSSDGTANGALNTGELFDPAGNSGAGTFTAILGSTLSAPRWQPEAALLAGGERVLIAGGQDSSGALASADIYIERTNKFVASAHLMAQARANGSAVSLPNGMVLLAGGTTSQAVELYDADSDVFNTTGSLQQSDSGLVSTLLNNGDVLVVGLTTASTPASDAELYTPSFNPLGTVGLTSSEATDSFGAACVLAPSTSTASTCTSSVTPANVATSPHVITATYPADTVHSTSNTTASLTVDKDDTTTTITANTPNPSVVNQAVSISVSVTANAPGAGTPTGTVTVSDGVGETCTVTLASGTGSCSLTPQAAGVDTLTAHYNGDSNFNISTSTGVSQTVNTRHTTSVLTFSINPVVVNQPTTVTLTVTDDDPHGTAETPAGTITFSSNVGSDVFNSTTCSLTGSGAAASCSVTLTAASANPTLHAITGSFPADSVHSASSNTQNLTVNTRHTTSALTFSSSTVVVNQPTTVTLTVTDDDPHGAAETPAGTITFSSAVVSDIFSSTTCTLSGTGASASCSVTLTAASANPTLHAITGSFPADNVHSASSNTQNLTVNTRHTTSALTFSINPVVVNQPTTATLTVTDDDPHGAAETPTGTITFSSAVVSDVFSSTTCTLSGTGASASCSVTLTAASANPTLHAITGSFPADNVHSASSNTPNLTVNTRHTTSVLRFSRSSSPVTAADVNQPTLVTLTVTDDDANGVAETPGGTITLSSSVGSDVFSSTTCTLSGTGAAASCSVTLTAASANPTLHAITGSFPVDSVHSASSSTPNLTVNTRHTTSVLKFSRSSSSVTAADVNQPTVVTLTVTDDDTNGAAETPSGTITFNSTVASDLFSSTTCTLSGSGATASCSVTLTGASANPAVHGVTGSFAVDTVHSTSSNAQNLTVNTRHTTATLSFSVTHNTVSIATPVTVTATLADDDANGGALTPAGTVSFTFGNGTDTSSATSCTLSGSGATASCSITLIAPNVAGGSHAVNISYPADTVHTASTGNSTLTVIPATTLTAISTSTNLQNFLGQSASFAVTVQNTAAGSAAAPTGAVQFLLDGSALGPVLPLTGTGTTSTAGFTADLTKVSAGSHAITVQYLPDKISGSNNFVAGSSGNAVAVSVAPVINNIPGQAISPVTLQLNSTGTSGNVTLKCNVQQVNTPIPASEPNNFPLCTLNQGSASLPATVTATITTVAASTSMLKAAPSIRGSHLAGLYSLGTPLGAVLGLLLVGGARSRRKYWSRRKLLTLLGMVLLLSVVLFVTGCGGGFGNPTNLQPLGNGTQQGTYVVSVMGIDSNGNTVAIATIPLNVQL